MMMLKEGMKLGICYPLHVKEEKNIKLRRKKQVARAERKKIEDKLPGRCC